MNNEENSNTVIEEKKPVESTKKVKNKRNLMVSFLLGILTIGLWNKMFPRKKGTKGTWSVSVLLLLIICLGLIGERFFKHDINNELKQALNTEIDIIPENWGFEEESNKDLTNENKLNYEDLLNEKNELLTRTQNQEEAISDLGKSMMKYKNGAVLLADENEKLAKENEYLTKNPLKVFIEPKISLISYDEIQNKVGCNSTYSEQKKIDVFNKNYAEKWVKWKGKISSVSNDDITINSKDGSGFKVEFKTPGVGYDLTVNKEISITFKLTTQGGCDTPFIGNNGVIEEL